MNTDKDVSEEDHLASRNLSKDEMQNTLEVDPSDMEEGAGKNPLHTSTTDENDF